MSRREVQTAAGDIAARKMRVGCVSYLNAKPLIDGLDVGSGNPGRGDAATVAMADATNPLHLPELAVRFDVPSRLRDDLLSGEADLALCPVFDYFASGEAADPADRLVLVPVGGIGCEGPTLTVRLFSQVPLEDLTIVHADTDSHTSAALVRVLLAELFNSKPGLIDYHAREHVAEGRIADRPEAVLLIGDKVVTDSPPAVTYKYQLDLGDAWHELTGLPFVFAMWMARPGTALGSLPQLLAERLSKNLPQRALIAERYAERHGWPIDLAEHYLTDVLTYQIGPRELEAVERYGAYLAKHGILGSSPGPLKLWPGGEGSRDGGR